MIVQLKQVPLPPACTFPLLVTPGRYTPLRGTTRGYTCPCIVHMQLLYAAVHLVLPLVVVHMVVLTLVQYVVVVYMVVQMVPMMKHMEQHVVISLQHTGDIFVQNQRA